MKYVLRILGLFVLTVGPVSAALADAANGLKLSQHWCAACHLVSADQKQASVDVPTFEDVARGAKDPKALALFLTKPHGQMPDMTLSQPEIADIIAYISTLGPNPVTPPPKAEPSRNGLSGAIVPEKK